MEKREIAFLAYGGLDSCGVSGQIGCGWIPIVLCTVRLVCILGSAGGELMFWIPGVHNS